MYGDWALPGREYSYISLVDLVRERGTNLRPRPIAHVDICAKPGDWFGGDDFSGPRFSEADPQFPGILVAGMPNPCALPYRMVDGRRRLEKLNRMGITESPFYVFDYQETLPYIVDFEIAP